MAVEPRSNGTWRVRADWSGWPKVEVTVDDPKLADDLWAVMLKVKGAGEVALLEELAAKRVTPRVFQQICSNERALYRGEITPEKLRQRGDPHGPTLGELYEGWLTHLRDPATVNRQGHPYATDTVDRYIDSCEAFFIVLGGLLQDEGASIQKARTLRLGAFTTEAVERFRRARLATGETSAGTVNNDCIALQAWSRWIVERHPTLTWARPRIQKTKAEPAQERHLEPDVYWQVRAEGERLFGADTAEAFDTILGLGGRLNEALELRAHQVHLEVSQVSLPEYTTRQGVRSFTTRSLPLMPHLRDLFARLVAAAGRPDARLIRGALANEKTLAYRFARACLKAGFHDGGEGWRQRTKRRLARAERVGDRAQVAELTRALERGPRAYKDRAPLYSIHGLRHTAATMWVRAGFNLLQVQAWLGHKNVTTTQRYVKGAAQGAVDPATLARASALLEAPPVTPVTAGPHLAPSRRWRRSKKAAN